MADPAKLYEMLLKLYPARFREEYRGPMLRQFHDEYRDTEGYAARSAFWLRTLADLASSIPATLAREFWQDLRYGMRAYRKRPGSTALAVLALGLAIGASSGVFSVLSALLLRTLPFTDAEQLVELKKAPMGAMDGRAAFSQWARGSSYLFGAAVFSASEMNVMAGRQALRVKAAETSANFFELLGTRPAYGRTFARDEDLPARAGVAVISYSLWQQVFGGDPQVSGATLHLNGIPLTVVGVAPPRFDYPGNTSVWVPSVFAFEMVPKRGAFLFQAIGRLQPEMSIALARERFEAEVRHRYPRAFEADAQSRPQLVLLRDQLAGPIGTAAWVLAGMIFLLLLAASANVAQLLLSRTTERRQELTLRAALGAGRSRLLQQLITEATALTVGGAALGLLIAWWVSQLASSGMPAPIASQQYTMLDWRVALFTIATAMAMGTVFGIVSAWFAGRLQPPNETLRSHPGDHDKGTRRMRAGLVALQACLTLTLLAASFSMGSTFLRLLDVDLGFETRNVVTLSVSLPGTRHSGRGEWRYYQSALERLRAIPGVKAAGAVRHLPLANDVRMANAFKLDSGQNVTGIVINAATPGYFEAMGTPFREGRDFARSHQASSPAVIVNEAFAEQAGAGSAVVGRRLTAPWTKTPYTIVGLVRTERSGGPAYSGAPQVFFAVEEEPPPGLMFAAKVQGDTVAFLAICRDALRSLDREVPINDVKTLDARLAEVLARPRFFASATLFLSLLALVLACVGIFGTAGHAVAQRTREIGIRLALGSSKERIRTMVMREWLTPICAGVVAGILASFAFGRYLEHLISSAQPVNVVTCSAAAALVLVVGIAATRTATARVLAVDPATAIRSE